MAWRTLRVPSLRLPSLRLIGLGLALIATTSGCQNAGSAGRRIAEDSFVFFTSPVQIPVMSARDAALFDENVGISIVAFPVIFPFYMLEHTILSVVHGLDLLAFPAHFFHDSESLGIYRPYAFPLRRDVNSEIMSEGFAAATLFALAIGLPIALAIFSAGTLF